MSNLTRLDQTVSYACNNNHKIQTKYSEEFELFWELYPSKPRHKGSKKVAHDSFLKALRITTLRNIVEGVQGYAVYISASREYNANASTWLNQHRWEDEYPIIKETEVLLDFTIDEAFEKRIKNDDWRKVRKVFLEKYGSAKFVHWIKDIACIKTSGTEVSLICSSNFTLNWIQQQYLIDIERYWRDVNSEIKKVKLKVD